MFREKVPARQLSAWLFAAIVPVALQLLSGSSWVWVGCAGVFAVVLDNILWRDAREAAKWECVILFIYVTILMGELLHHTAQSWPVGNSDPAVPLILLALAVWSAQKGPSAAARVGAVLFWVVLGLYFAVLSAGIKGVTLSWLMPKWDLPDILGLTLLLLPCGAAGLLKGRGSAGKRGWLTAGFILAGTIITAGVLSPSVAIKTENAFYEMSRSLVLLGVARRFEALICAGTTVGWFALLTLLLTLCGSYSQKIYPGLGRGGVWAAAGAAAIWKLCGLHIMPSFLLLTGAVFWVAIPILTQGLGLEKKS